MLNFLSIEGGGGYTFYTSDKEKVGIPIGHVRKGVSDGGIDIAPLMDVIGASRDAAQSKLPKKVSEGIDHLVTAWDTNQAIEDGYERLGKTPEVDSTYCETCSKNVPTSSTSEHTLKKR